MSQTVIFLGPQGSGKGTQAKLLAEYLEGRGESVSHFTLGQSLREFMQGAGHTQQLVLPSMNRGELQPLFLVATLFGEHLIKTISTGQEHLLIDGLPREENQLPVLDTALAFYGRERAIVCYINISDEEAVRRLVLRGRVDDTEEGIRKRLAWTHRQADAINEQLRRNPRYRVLEVAGERPVQEVHADIVQKLGFA